jgi:hypothetical protein
MTCRVRASEALYARQDQQRALKSDILSTLV